MNYVWSTYKWYNSIKLYWITYQSLPWDTLAYKDWKISSVKCLPCDIIKVPRIQSQDSSPGLSHIFYPQGLPQEFVPRIHPQNLSLEFTPRGYSQISSTKFITKVLKIFRLNCAPFFRWFAKMFSHSVTPFFPMTSAQ